VAAGGSHEKRRGEGKSTTQTQETSFKSQESRAMVEVEQWPKRAKKNKIYRVFDFHLFFL